MFQKRDPLVDHDPDVVQVDFSTQAGSVWPSVGVALEEVRSSTLTNLVQPCRSRVPPATSAMLGAQVPMAVVAPIKRELPDQVPLVPDEQTAVVAAATAGAEKYSLPPFETLVTSHRSPEMTSPSTATDKQPATVGVGVPSTVGVGVPSSMVGISPETMVRLPGIHQLFQTTSGSQPIAGTGTGNSLTAVNEGAVRYTSSTPTHPMATQNNRMQLFSQQQQPHLVQFFAKTEDDLVQTDALPPPPPYPGLPGPSSDRSCLVYGGVRNVAVEYDSFQSVLSSTSVSGRR